MNKICTSLEQSKKLIELGIDVNTADMFWLTTDKPRLHVLTEDLEKYSRWDCMPAWSLAALLELIPITCVLSISNGHYRIVSNETNTFFHNNPLDAVFEIICLLKRMNEITCNNCKDKKYCSQSEYIKNNCYKLNK